MNFRPIIVVARKELTDGFRDRRALYSLLFGCLFGPLFISYMLTQEAKQEHAAQEITIPIVGRENSPMLVQWLEQQPGVATKAGPADAEKAVRDGIEDVVLIIDKDFAEKFKADRPAPVKVVSDSNRMSSGPKARRVHSLLTAFSAQMGGMRLVARGVNPVVARALKVEDVEVSSAQQRIAKLFNFIPLFLIMAAVTAGMQLATDTTAGERERLSLEPLLITPVPRWQLVAGKWLAASGAAVVGMLLTLFLLVNIFKRLSLEDLGVRFRLDMPEAMFIFAAVVPMAFLTPALQIYLACFAKSFKEAQSYMGFLILAIVAPGMISVFHPLGDSAALKVTPFLGQTILADDVLAGNIPSIWLFGLAAIAALALTAVFLWLATRLFHSEKIIFGR